jgi:hypothetical protein
MTNTLKIVPKVYQINLSLNAQEYDDLMYALHSVFEGHNCTKRASDLVMKIHDDFRVAQGDG